MGKDAPERKFFIVAFNKSKNVRLLYKDSLNHPFVVKKYLAHNQFMVAIERVQPIILATIL